MKLLSAYLGLDLGTQCGFARYDHLGNGGAYMTGAWDLSITRFDSPHVRFERFGQRLDDHFSIGITKVFYEKVARHKGTIAAHVYGAFLNKLHEKCAEYGVPFEGLSVQEIKTHATGKGGGPKANKEAMVAAAHRAGFHPRTEDEADAIWIVKCGMETRL